MFYLVVTCILVIGMLVYFRLAFHYRIVDKPNERSSHSRTTIRGGGILYVLAALILGVCYPSLWMPISGIFAIGAISFIDDIYTISNKLRLFIHLLAVSVLFYALNIYSVYPWWGYAALYIFVIGTINAYNFMDGINGITGLYSLVILLAFQYVNLEVHPFVQPELIWVPVLATLVFLFYNFRTKARCFAGDVGSISIAFWILWLLLSLIMQTQNYSYILFLGVYGVDSVFTIVHRLWLKQNVMEPHRLHFYQLLVNEKKVPHLWVSTGYALLQALVCIVVVHTALPWYAQVLICLGPLALIYLLVKPGLMQASTGSA